MALSITTRGGVRVQGTEQELRDLAETLLAAADCGHGFATDGLAVVLLGPDGKPALPRRDGAGRREGGAVRPTAPEPELEAEEPDLRAIPPIRKAAL